MRGIADGAAKAGAKIDGRAVDFLDVVTLNSSIDLGYLRSALAMTPHALGRSFLTTEDEVKSPSGAQVLRVRRHRPGDEGRPVVFGQIFMWSGYTGVHFDVVADVVPSKGSRLVYETFPGGIHSGTDFYMNEAGIMIGETTVAQTPWTRRDAPSTASGGRRSTPARSTTSCGSCGENNGLYTNDWPIADVKTDEIAILLLGTSAGKLWRSRGATSRSAPRVSSGREQREGRRGAQGVRRRPSTRPSTSSSAPGTATWPSLLRPREGEDRRARGGRRLATSPINRPHACDGKVTTSEMAEKLVFLAHYGKVTLREKFPREGFGACPTSRARSPPDARLLGLQPH